ncbi:MAG TPA: Rap1a/Tai family immunity protein [Xanthobacteraceae bacterium]|nr:Rap1a/Tai family immunity protein [Xanthobacteraceae bacterium]
MKTKIIAGVAALLICGPAIAQNSQPATVTDQELYQSCKSTDPLDQITCTRFLEGVAAMMRIASALIDDPKSPRHSQDVIRSVSICLKDGVSGVQMRQVFINWAEQNPTKWQNQEGFGAWIAFQKAWPCR